MTTPRCAASAVFAVALLLGACGDDDSEDTATSDDTTTTMATSTSTSTTDGSPTNTSPPVTISTSERCATESSTGVVDEDRGLYTAWVATIDVEARTLEVDIMQFLLGEDATAAWQEKYPDDPGGPPNDYFIRNESEQLRTFPVADDVSVRVLAESANLTDTDFEALPDAFAIRPSVDPGRLSFNPFWIAVNGGQITGICEQFIP